MRFAAPFEFPVLRVFDCEGAVEDFGPHYINSTFLEGLIVLDV